MDDQHRYGGTAITLHWAIVVLLVGQYALGWLMPEVHRGTAPVGLIEWHLSIGLCTLALAAARLVWRLTHRPPAAPAAGPALEVLAYRYTHLVLYVLLLLVPLTGWLNSSGRAWKPLFFGAFGFPGWVLHDVRTSRSIGELHSSLAILLLAVVGVHVLAALYHQLYLKDRLLSRMWIR
ncbi:MAG: cytochrome b/b6 domain-containing protein [Pseudomonadota bacterium]|nr:cytochrome b/b6 domain-containing protein [Pseudomonadota bacterium]